MDKPVTIAYTTADMTSIMSANNHASPAKPRSRVVVGLSGGVDSSVTAALLKQQGHEVIGVYMKNWNDQSPTLGDRPLAPDAYRLACPWYDDYLDAKRVALRLDIPFYSWDFREAYKTKVFDHFLAEFEKGRTPNPDIYCNSLVKFDDFLTRALEELGTDWVATGHYARLVEQGQQRFLQIPTDAHKDQTYFLYRLTQDQLSRVIFSLADYTKVEVRALAAQFDLPTQKKRDSQGICFIGDVEIRQFISHWLAPKLGPIIDETGQVIGQHKGVHLYTIGEKLAVDSRRLAKLYPDQKQAVPHYYVAKKELANNTIVAVPGVDHRALYADRVVLEDVVWASDTKPKQLRARFRHGGALVAGELINKTIFRFTEPQRALAPGQHLVVYDSDNRVVGGGVIAS